MQGVILAAGKGRRLQPITRTRPKAMVPILGKPIITRVMESLIDVGVNRFLIVLNPNDELTHDYLTSQTNTYIPIDIVYQDQPLGMANALLCAADRIRGDFILSACDNLVSILDLQDLLTLWQQSDSVAGVLSLIQVNQQELNCVGVVALDGNQVTRIVEKPTPEKAPSLIASIPLYLFSPKILTYLSKVEPSPRGEYELQDAIQMLINDKHTVVGMQVRERHTVNNLDDLLRLNLVYFERSQSVNVVKSEITKPDVQIIPPVYIEENVAIDSGCTIGPHVFLERNSRIGAGVTLENTIVLANASVTPSANLFERIVT